MFLNTLTLETRNQWGQDENEHSRVSLLPNSTYHIICPPESEDADIIMSGTAASR